MHRLKPIVSVLAALFALSLSVTAALAQGQARLRGQITDQTGASVSEAQVTLTGAAGLVKTATAAKDGSYSFVDLPSGDYTVEASAPNLALPEPVTGNVKPGVQTLNLQLRAVSGKEEESVQ